MTKHIRRQAGGQPSFFVAEAQSLAELRRMWDGFEAAAKNTDSPLFVPLAEYKKMHARVSGNLTRLGVDLRSKDERVRDFNASLSKAHDSRGIVPLASFHPFTTSLYRLLSGSRQREGKMELLPLEKLVEADTRRQLAEKFIAFIGSPKPKRFRQPYETSYVVTDPESEFWGFTIDKNDWPNKVSGGKFGSHITLQVPTGRVSAASMKQQIDLMGVPTRIPVQAIHVRPNGRVTDHPDYAKFFDTESGLVARFLNSV